jgi:hypothetical protein
MPAISFPTSTAPGFNGTESGGRLINCIVEQTSSGARGPVAWRRAPGLTTAFELDGDAHRGAIAVDNVLYALIDDTVYSVTKSGTTYTATALTGTVGGTGPVTMARNMATIPNVFIEHSDGVSLIDINAGSVGDFTDVDLPDINSITWLDGYFFASSANGGLYQSGINATTWSGLDYTTAESSPDGLVRVVALGRDLLAMGDSTIEWFANAGNATGFAFDRGTVLPIGLASKFAVAGFEQGFGYGLVFVANDDTVRLLNGYTPQDISPPWLKRWIADTDPDDLEMSVYVVDGHAYAVLSSTTWTVQYDLTSGSWIERKSYGSTLWRAHFGVYCFNEWLVFDRSTGKVFRPGRSKTEDGDPLLWELQSTQQHKFPSRMRIPRASFDFVTGVGIDTGADPIETNPRVLVSWSDDGGLTWSTPLERLLGAQGQDVNIDVRNCGITNRRGRMWRLQVSDPVEVSFMGGAMDVLDLS